MTINYNLDIPDGPHNPSVDQPMMKVNTNAIQTLVSVDHYGFNAASGTPGGYHKVIHQLDQATDPTTIASTNQLYAKVATIPAALQLFSKNAAGTVFQMTGSLRSQTGWGWMAGVLHQWGISTTSSGTILLPVTFPTAFLTVTATSGYNGPGNVPAAFQTIFVDYNSLTTSSFNITVVGTAGPTPKFFWHAIGY